LGKIPAPTAAIGEWLLGTLVSLSGLAGSDPWLHLEVSARSPRKTRQFELHCEGGVAWLDDGWAGHIQVARGKDGYGGDAGAVEVRSISNELPLLRELRAFVEHLSGGPPPRSSAAEGAAVVRAIYDLRVLAGEAR
jgi:predicted dehydrogenase